MKDKKYVIWAQYTDEGKIVDTIRCSTDIKQGATEVWGTIKKLVDTCEKFGS